MVKVNKKIVDAWSIPHFIIGYLFGRYAVLDTIQFTTINAGWELFENLMLKKPYDIMKSKGNIICDFIIGEAGYFIGLYQYLMDRPMVDYISKTTNHELIGVEIGVYMGHNSENIMKKLPIKKLYLVDPYKTYYQDPQKHAFLPPFIENSKNAAHIKMMPYTGRYQFIEMFSNEASKYVPNQLDFVYIDGNHSYDFVMNDITTWYEKIRTDGVIGGHDYNLPEVKRAVDDFAKTHNKTIQTGNIDWWIIK